MKIIQNETEPIHLFAGDFTTLSIYDYIIVEDRMTAELEKIWEEATVAN
jgi:hypothetical protein